MESRSLLTNEKGVVSPGKLLLSAEPAVFERQNREAAVTKRVQNRLPGIFIAREPKRFPYLAY